MNRLKSLSIHLLSCVVVAQVQFVLFISFVETVS
jgi:hypothetical protein